MYYNTTNQKGEVLNDLNVKTERQEVLIEHLYKRYFRLSPSQAWKLFNKPGTPITSIRRGITNLTSDGKLIKTNEKIKGLWGRDEHIYQLKFEETLF